MDTKTKQQLYDVTAEDDTRIRRPVFPNATLGDAVAYKEELIFTHRRRWRNPRIRKHRND